MVSENRATNLSYRGIATKNPPLPRLRRANRADLFENTIAPATTYFRGVLRLNYRQR